MSGGDGVSVQPEGYVLELSLDWIVLRASENIHHLLGESHVTLIDEPLGRFVHAQALHDLRNLFSRLSGTTGIARAYRVRLADHPNLVDIAFQLSDGRVLLEAVPSAPDGFGEAFGTVGGLIAHLAGCSGQALLDSAARCMRALTGYDRVTLVWGDRFAESSRGTFASPAGAGDGLPPMLCDCDGAAVPLFPRRDNDTAASRCLLRTAGLEAIERLHEQSVRATLTVPIVAGSDTIGRFRCDSRTSRVPNFELHAAAELFAQMFAMRLAIDEIGSR
jgi:light-regulated signal transduction histidine kinase (bacteriophytochrome)